MTLPSVWSVLPRSSEQLQWCCVTYGSHISTVHWEVPYRTFTSHSSQGCHIDSCKIAPRSAALKYEYLHIREEYLKIYDLVWCIIKVYGALPTLCIRPMPTLLHNVLHAEEVTTDFLFFSFFTAVDRGPGGALTQANQGRRKMSLSYDFLFFSFSSQMNITSTMVGNWNSSK